MWQSTEKGFDMWKDSESNIDYIDFEYIADLVNEIVMDDSLLPASIGVYGDWGSGKSSIMSISQKALNKKDNDALIINFNSWLFEDYGDAKNTVINCILDQIEVKIKNIIYCINKKFFYNNFIHTQSVKYCWNG